MLIIGLICRKSSLFGLQKIDRQDLPLFLIAGFCQPFLYYMLETFTYQALNSPTIAETLLSTSPLLSPFFAAVFLHERVTRNNIIGILVSTAGVFALTLIGSSNYSIGNYWGILLAFAAVSSAVVDAIMMRKVPAKYSSLTFIFYAQLVSLIFFIPIWFLQEGPAVLAAIDWNTLADQSSSLFYAITSVAYLTVFASVIAFILFCFAIRKVGVTQANAFNNIRPAFTALWMFLFFGEHLPVGKWIGMALIIVGLFVCQKKEAQ
jgi:drug/metabolite transporter (DMT)-like permease